MKKVIFFVVKSKMLCGVMCVILYSSQIIEGKESDTSSMVLYFLCAVMDGVWILLFRERNEKIGYDDILSALKIYVNVNLCVYFFWLKAILSFFNVQSNFILVHTYADWENFSYLIGCGYSTIRFRGDIHPLNLFEKMWLKYVISCRCVRVYSKNFRALRKYVPLSAKEIYITLRNDNIIELPSDLSSEAAIEINTNNRHLTLRGTKFYSVVGIFSDSQSFDIESVVGIFSDSQSFDIESVFIKNLNVRTRSESSFVLKSFAKIENLNLFGKWNESSFDVIPPPVKKLCLDFKCILQWKRSINLMYTSIEKIEIDLYNLEDDFDRVALPTLTEKIIFPIGIKSVKILRKYSETEILEEIAQIQNQIGFRREVELLDEVLSYKELDAGEWKILRHILLENTLLLTRKYFHSTST